MIFWTIVFFAVSLYGVFRGSMFSSASKKMTKISIELAEGGDKEKLGIEFLKQGCLSLILAVFLLVSEIIYLINALSIDPLKYPTIGAISCSLLSLLFLRKVKVRIMMI